MKVILIRHAIALPRGTPGVKDDDRPLTPEGEKKFGIAARGLARVTRRPDVLLTSPLVRAARTAVIAARALKKIEPQEAHALAGGTLKEVGALLGTLPGEATVALVGHEPHLSRVLAHLLGAREAKGLVFRKGGAALVDLPEGPAGRGSLVWFLPPRILRKLARAKDPDERPARTAR